MNLAATLQHAQSQDFQARGMAEQQLKQWEDQSLPQFMHALAAELASEANPPGSRQLSGLHLKNLLTARDATKADEKRKRYFQSVDPAIRGQIKASCLGVLLSPVAEAAHVAAQVVAMLGAVELEVKQWPELLGLLLENMNKQDAPDGDLCKQVTLETLGYICEELDEDVIEAQQTNQILTAIVDGMRDERPEAVRIAAARALLNSLVFTRHNFETEVERTMIMQTVCHATKSTNEKLRIIAYESLARVASLYYDKLPQYIETLFQLTLTAIQSDSEQVAMMAIEFWSTLCEEEMEILEDLEGGNPEARKCANYVEAAAQHVVPVLLNNTLTKQDEDADEDAWNVSAAGAISLGLVAETIRDKIVGSVLQFVEANIMNEDWRRREASIMAFGQILEGPSPDVLTGPVQTAMPVLVQALGDQHTLVKDTTAWTLARICELHTERIPPGFLNPLVEKLVQAMQDSSRVAARACYAVHNLAQALEELQGGGRDAQTNPLSPHFQALLTQLFAATERPDWQDHNLRGEAYEAITMLLQTHAADTRPLVIQAMQLVLQRLHATFGMQIVSQDDKTEQYQLQSLLCAVIQVITRGIDKEVLPFADHIIQLLLQVLSNQNATAAEEAFMAIGALATAIESGFEKYMQAFFPHLLQGLKNAAEWQVCSAAVGTTGDICRALESRGAQVPILRFCDDIVQCLLHDLTNPELSRLVKPAVLSCFGDIAFAIGGHFEKYLSPTLAMLEQASKTEVDQDDEELVEYLNTLHEGILEAYTGIIRGLSDGGKAALLLPHLANIFTFLEVVCRNVKAGLCDDDVGMYKTIIGIVGDVADTLVAHKAEVKPFLSHPLVAGLLQESQRNPREEPGLADLGKWANEKITKYN